MALFYFLYEKALRMGYCYKGIVSALWTIFFVFIGVYSLWYLVFYNLGQTITSTNPALYQAWLESVKHLLVDIPSTSLNDQPQTSQTSSFMTGTTPIERLRHFVNYQSKTKNKMMNTLAEDRVDNYDTESSKSKINDNSISDHTVTSIGDLLIDRMDHFVAVGCTDADSFESAQKALRGQLQSIPENVRDDIVSSVLIERTSVYNVIQNSSKPMIHTMKASAYLAWYSTTFTPPSSYSYCIIVSGISFVPGESVVGYDYKVVVENIGETPCHCGLFRCLSCPVFREQRTEIPIFKSHVLTLDQHNELHQYMVDKAMELAENTMALQNKAISDHNKKQDSTIDTSKINTDLSITNRDVIQKLKYDAWNINHKNNKQPQSQVDGEIESQVYIADEEYEL
jgi:hypothetical protein